MFRATRLLECLAALLRASFPNAAVPVPADVVLALATRAASPDGAAVAAAPGLPSVAIPAETLAAFPALHVAAANLTTALVRCGGGTIARLAGAVARRVESNVRAGGGIEDGAGKSRVATRGAPARAATYRLAAAAARAFGPAYAANELAAVVVPAAAADAVGGWRGVGSSVGSNGGRAAFAAAASRRASAANVSSKRRKKGGAWGQAGAEEMEAFLAAGGLLDRRGGTAGGSAGAAAYAVRAAALDALDATPVAGRGDVAASANAADAAVAEAAASAVAAATAAPSTAAFVERSARRHRGASRGVRRVVVVDARRARFVRKIFPSRLRRFAPRDERTRRWAIARGARC